MSYTVLARKYRSKSFDDVVGQEPIATTLKNAISTGRIHHGYLFTGTRGVGKTSMARILAKALNCLKSDGPTTLPCGQCDSCQSIASGEDVDVIEIDAASNTGVDNIRELRSNAVYRPARARFKIYIIDEVHMLSTGAFNALLKTLEEPPEHVKFIMATTEPQKVPATIQSRVQRFDFRPIPAQGIADQLERICKSEQLQAEPAALRRIARLASGSMRDAVSLLDQLLSIGAKKLSLELLEQVLPRPGDEQICDLVDKLIAQDPAASLTVLDQVVSSGHALESLVLSLMEHLRGMMLLRVCGPQTELVDATEALRAKMVEQSKTFDEPTYVYMLTLLEELRRSVRYSGTGRALVEAAIVRLCMLDAFTSLQSLAAAPRVSPERQPGSSSAAPSATRGSLASASPSSESPRSSLRGTTSAPGAAPQSSALRTQDSALRSQRSEVRSQDSGLSTQDSVLSPPPSGLRTQSSSSPPPPVKKVDSPSSAEATEAGEIAEPGSPSHPAPPAPAAPAPTGPQPRSTRPAPAHPAPVSMRPGPASARPGAPTGAPRGAQSGSTISSTGPQAGSEIAPRTPARGTSSQDIRKVTANPVVRRAIELFEGTLVGVRPANPSVPGVSAPARPDDKDSAEYPPEPDETDSDSA